MGQRGWMDWSQWDREALSYSAFTHIQYYNIIIEVFTPLLFLKLIHLFPSISLVRWTLLDLGNLCSSLRTSSCFLWETWQYWEVKTSRTSLALLSDRCVSARGREKAVPPWKTFRTKSWIPRGQLEQLLNLSQCSRFSFLFLLFGGICSLRLSDSTFLSLRGHKRPQIFLWRIYFVYRDIGLVLNNLKVYVFFILYT